MLVAVAKTWFEFGRQGADVERYAPPTFLPHANTVAGRVDLPNGGGWQDIFMVLRPAWTLLLRAAALAAQKSGGSRFTTDSSRP